MAVCSQRPFGYMAIMLMMVVFVLALGLTVAVPVWETQIRRENEEELIFRGKQYVEAVRLYQLANPGRFPSSLKELLDKKCLRKPFRDPMTKSGEWDIILNPAGVDPAQQGGESAQTVLVAPERVLAAMESPSILGVVSSSKRKSIKIYYDQERYDKWLFFYGQDPSKLPKVVRLGLDGEIQEEESGEEKGDEEKGSSS